MQLFLKIQSVIMPWPIKTTNSQELIGEITFDEVKCTTETLHGQSFGSRAAISLTT